MEIIKKDSKLYFKIYEIRLDTDSDSRIDKTCRFTNWDLAKEYAFKLLGYSKNGSLTKGLCKWYGEVEDIEPPKLEKKVNLYIEYYSFKPNKKYAREKWIYIETILAEITLEEIEELRSLSL